MTADVVDPNVSNNKENRQQDRGPQTASRVSQELGGRRPHPERDDETRRPYQRAHSDKEPTTSGYNSQSENNDGQAREQEYERGDPEKGRIDPEDIAFAQNVGQVAIRDRRAYLIDQAEKNESANDEINARMVEKNKKLSEAQAIALDPDEMRANSMESAIAEIELHDQQHARDTQIQRQQIQRARRLAARGHTVDDSFIAGPDTETEPASQEEDEEPEDAATRRKRTQDEKDKEKKDQQAK